MGAVLTGCGEDDKGTGRPVLTEAEAVRADKALRRAAAHTGALALAHYDLVTEAHPDAAAGLAPLRPCGSTSGPWRRGARSRPPPHPVPVSTDRPTALKELAAAERRRADAHAEALLTAEPELARLLASVAAGAAAHAYLLTELAKETPS
ncbi:hypothetical protein EQG64_26835 [Streptomyces sp. S6]|nr:hypothetical protein EQG64_26835 [Streptomyces sp. S6]